MGKEFLVIQAIATVKFNCGDRFPASKNLTILKSWFSGVVKIEPPAHIAILNDS
ncbi:hypothetical protein QUB37_16370 [Microcoleus sp. AT3-A2]|uniref:hypothetical protein n=1 Tax=Microcoleus sp. Pol10D4 TaxID=3055387 RepID=UPI002FD2637B